MQEMKFEDDNYTLEEDIFYLKNRMKFLLQVLENQKGVSQDASSK